MKNLLTTAEMARRLNISLDTLRKWRVLGCAVGQRHGRDWLYAPEDRKLIIAWRQENLLPHGRPPKKEESCLSK